jgi:hypothetical protein
MYRRCSSSPHSAPARASSKMRFERRAPARASKQTREAFVARRQARAQSTRPRQLASIEVVLKLTGGLFEASGVCQSVIVTRPARRSSESPGRAGRRSPHSRSKRPRRCRTVDGFGGGPELGGAHYD